METHMGWNGKRTGKGTGTGTGTWTGLKRDGNRMATALGARMLQKDGDTRGRSGRWSQSGPAECCSGECPGAALLHPRPEAAAAGIGPRWGVRAPTKG